MRGFSPGKEFAIFIIFFITLFFFATNGAHLARAIAPQIKPRVRSANADLSFLAGVLRSASPRLADYAADLVLVMGLVVALLFLQFLISAPLGLYSLCRKVRMLEAQLAEVRCEIRENSRLIEARLAPRPESPATGDVLLPNYRLGRGSSRQTSAET